MGPATRAVIGLVAASAFLSAHAASGGPSLTHVIFAGVILLALLMLERWRPVVMFCLPFIILTAAYDMQSFVVAQVISMPVHVSELRTWELSWFGIAAAAGRVTPAEWFQTHTTPWLDAVCGLAYMGFMAVFLAMAVWWRVHERPAEAQTVMWALLWLHLAGYFVHIIYPTAPPWYVAHYGVEPASRTVPPEAAGAARFDHLLGISWFANSYSRSANVFGACPSLHVGQAFLAVLFARHFRSLRAIAFIYWMLVTLASVYLNHHYIVDGLVGMAFAIGAYSLVRHQPRSLSP